jgi:hypothetical protein
MSYTKVERSVRRVACLFCVPRSLLALFANLVGVTSAEDSHWHNLITSSREEHLMRLYFAFASFWHFPLAALWCVLSSGTINAVWWLKMINGPSPSKTKMPRSILPF